ncbi:MAG: hypothetical protein AAGB51_01440 [Planctomycetota bacterium]
MSSLGINILVTGQLRTPALFRRSLADWVALRDEGVLGRVVVATWKEDAEREPDLVRELHEQGCEVITAVPPPVRGIGHIWPQTLSLDLGLREFSSTDRVLKTRADLHIDAEFVRKLATDPGMHEITDQAAAFGVFGGRVWLPWFELTKPFYMADECFAGAAKDLARLINYDESYSVLYDIGCGVTHVRRFIHAFREPFGIFDRFLSRYADAGHFSPERWQRVEALLSDDGFLDVLASYYMVLAAFFRIEGGQGTITFRDWSSGVRSPGAGPMQTAFGPDQSWSKDGGHLYSYDEQWLRTVLNGKLPQDALAKRFVEAVERQKSVGLPLDPQVAPVVPSRMPA